MEPSAFSQLPAELMWQLAAFVLAFGCCVGSYLNVVIYRLPLGMKTSQPRRSFCPACKYRIPFWHNLPVLSWLLLRGKCAHCRAPISPRYLFVELFTGLLFLGAFCLLGWDWKLPVAWTFLGLAVAGSCIDMDHQILPHEITWGGTAAGILAAALVPDLIVSGGWRENLLHSVAGAAAGYGIIWCIVHLGKLAFGRLRLAFDRPADWSVTQPDGAGEPLFTVDGQEESWSDIFSRDSDRLMIRAVSASLDERRLEQVLLTIGADSVQVTPDGGGEAEVIPLESIRRMSGTCTAVEQPREAMGMGDANWMACVGAFFGWKAVLFTILAGSCLGSVVSLAMILLRRREWAARIPFGPYLAAGAVIWLFWGRPLLAWYLTLAHGGGDGL